MSGGLFTLFKQGLLDASFDFLNSVVKAALIDLNAVAGIITDATNATPIVITQTAHGWSNGDVATIQGVVGNLAANGKFRIANVTANTYELTAYGDGSNVVGTGAYSSGGLAFNLTSNTVWSDVSAGLVGDSVALTTKDNTNGVFDADDVTFTAVTGNEFEAVILYIDTGTPSTSTLAVYLDQSSGVSFAVTPSGGDIIAQWSSGLNKIFRL